MKPRAQAVVLVAAVAALTLLPVWPGTPAWVAALVFLGAVAAMPRGRGGLWVLAVVAMGFNALLLALVVPGAQALSLGPVRLGTEGALRGAAGGLRLAAVVGVNLAALRRAPPALLLEDLRPPRRLAGWVAAVLLAAIDLGRDLERLRDARRLEGTWPEGRTARARAYARILPRLLVLAQERGRTRAEALRMAGVGVGPSFAPTVAVTAVAVLGRIPFVALPNVALTYVAVFLGGMVFGARAGAVGGMLAMLVTDVALSGLLPTAFVNVPAMGLLGLLGAAVGRFDFAGASRTDRVAGRILAGCAGFLATLTFSAVSDLGTWLLVPEFRGDMAVLRAIVAAGFVFNVIPALLQALVFAAAVGPVQVAFRAVGKRSTAA